jgi:hypothetical protein
MQNNPFDKNPFDNINVYAVLITFNKKFFGDDTLYEPYNRVITNENKTMIKKELLNTEKLWNKTTCRDPKYQDVLSKIIYFPSHLTFNLRKLTILNCVNLKYIGYLHFLEVLLLSNCPSLRSLQNYDTLELLELISCPGISNLPNYVNLYKLRIDNCNGITRLPEYATLKTFIFFDNINLTVVPYFPRLSLFLTRNCPIFINNGIIDTDSYLQYFTHDADSLRDYSEESEMESESDESEESGFESDFGRFKTRRAIKTRKRSKTRKATKTRKRPKTRKRLP